jgi:hypothetical protein
MAGYLAAVHVQATEMALALLDGKVPEFFTAGVDTVAGCSVDPDYFRNPAAPQLRDGEYPEHYTKWEVLKAMNLPASRYEFLDLCAARGLKPKEVGLLPYAVAEWTQRLALALAEHRRWPDDAGIRRKCLVYAGLLAHYAQDACQPLHTTADYDGRARADGSSRRSGIHLKIDALPAKVKVPRTADGRPVLPRELKAAAFEELMPAIFRQIQQSHSLVETVYQLEKDVPAVEDALPENEKVAAFARERLLACAAFTASLYLTAWEQSVKVEVPSWVQRQAPSTGPASRPAAVPPAATGAAGRLPQAWRR